MTLKRHLYSQFNNLSLKIKVLVLILLNGWAIGISQVAKLPDELQQSTKHAKIVSFCECVHSSDDLLESQINLIAEIHKTNKIESIFIEANNLYISKFKIASEINKIDNSIKIFGYNPGFLYGSYKTIKSNLSKSEPKFVNNISNILNQLDSNEAYYWYTIIHEEYDTLINQLNRLKSTYVDERYQENIDQLTFDLFYLKKLKQTHNNDKIRDSLMFEFIKKRIHINDSSKYIILGHCGHLSLKNPYHTKNLGFYLNQEFGQEMVSIGSDSRKIEIHIYERNRAMKKKIPFDGKIPDEGIFLPTNGFDNKKYGVFLIGSDFKEGINHKLNLKENYNWVYFRDTIHVNIKSK